jgi:hypothetical protein
MLGHMWAKFSGQWGIWITGIRITSGSPLLTLSFDSLYPYGKGFDKRMVSVLDPLCVNCQLNSSDTYSDHHHHHYKVHPEISQHTWNEKKHTITTKGSCNIS